ncbi:MAG: hypothetical protein ACJ8H8_25995 [Geminicoccaceae bacterium]
MVRLFALMVVALLAAGLPGPVRAEDPGEVMGDLLELLSERQNEPLAAVLAELRQECEQGDNEEEACAITALRPYLLQQLPVPAK